ncbi:small oligopeptide transporter [Trichodelitschia bisporula]|uniref:Small oligopeptide transporter n=1 Tax=Trichodelitschia bisporula TaxID=703511 RepID=A0A6G1HJ49_9PEZI|nr:small oligopeptide transporter [Trichodelitschia bisporula]
MNRFNHGDQGGDPAREKAHATGVSAHDVDATQVERDIAHLAALGEWDPNMDNEKLKVIEETIADHDIEAELALEHELEENSPYPEVVAAVSNVDDPSLPANTVRAWILGMTFVTIGSGLNMLFSLRQPTISLGSIVAQLCAYPVGMFMAKALPTRKFSFFGIPWTFNPGPFNKKEHTLITIMANVSFAGGAAYSTYTVEAMRGFYKIDWGFGFAIMFTLVTQMLGLGLAGLFRRFLVEPPAMIWPAILPNCALFNTLHDVEDNDPTQTNGWVVPRFRFFLIVLGAGFIWYWFPGYLFQALSVFAWVTWIKPNNVLVNQLFGGFTGLSLAPPFTVFTLDWTMIASYTGSPLMSPWHAIANCMIGVVVFTWIVTGAIHYSGNWYSDYLPLSDSLSYDNTAGPYKVANILTPQYTLDLQKYKEYSPIYLSTTFALQYGLSFATIIAVVVHTALYHGKDIWTRFRTARTEPRDIHGRLMMAYKGVPQWWFMAMFAVMIGLGFASVLAWDTKLPWWGFVLAVFISAAWMVPIGMIMAITNVAIGLNVFTEYIISYILPGRPIAMMAFKTLGYITMSQGLTYAMDLKMGYYMKVPPRTLFWGQLVASAWSCFVQVGVLQWAFANIPDICTRTQASKFTCPNGRVFFNASVIWGVIGPQRMFATDGTSVYGVLQWFWLVGFLMPLAFYFLAKRFPRSPLKYLNAPVILGGTGNIPPAVPMNYLMWGLVGYIFNKHIRSRYRGWWLRYNYILSAALDAGLALATILIFFTITMTKTPAPKWWGNNVVESTMDNQGTAVRKVLEKGQIFGPPPGSW